MNDDNELWVRCDTCGKLARRFTEKKVDHVWVKIDRLKQGCHFQTFTCDRHNPERYPVVVSEVIHRKDRKESELKKEVHHSHRCGKLRNADHIGRNGGNFCLNRLEVSPCSGIFYKSFKR